MMPHTNWERRTNDWKERQGGFGAFDPAAAARENKSTSLRNRMRSLKRLLSRPVRCRLRKGGAAAKPGSFGNVALGDVYAQNLPKQMIKDKTRLLRRMEQRVRGARACACVWCAPGML